MPGMATRRSGTDFSPSDTGQHGWNPLTLALLAALWIAGPANWPLWRALARLPEMDSTRGMVFVLGFGVMVAALHLALLALFAWRHSAKPVIALFLVSAALAAHFMGSYGVVIDPTMMTNVLQTDPRETRDLLNGRLAASVLLLAGVPLALLWQAHLSATRVSAQALRNGLALLASLGLVVALVLAMFIDLSATMRNHKSIRYLINPVNAFWSLGVLAVEANARPAGPPVAIGNDARLLPRAAGAKPPLLLLVVGETARADHFSLNGYARPTNPELARLPVTSFRNVTSCGTNTAESLPCMFSHLGRAGHQARERDHENLLDLLQRAGLAVLWLDNQSGCKGLCDRVPHARASDPADPASPLPPGLCADGECLDDALLHDFGVRWQALDAARRARGTVIVLHPMGSHGPAYFKRSPPSRKPFLPECTTNVLQSCDRQQLINAYDNSIAYTDHVLAQAIGWLTAQAADHDASLLYVSDHGESLGENNLFLHGLPYALAPREQTHVPVLLWLSADGDAARRLRPGCLPQQRDAVLSHDHLFHTVLGLVGVAAAEYQPKLDLLAGCR